MSEEQKTTVEEMKAVRRKVRSESRALIVATVFGVAALALSLLAWSGRCPLAAAGPTAAVESASAQAATSPATGADHGDQAADAEIEWLTDFERAVATAKRLDRPVLIDFAASWCVPCQMMEKHVWPKEAARRVLAEQVVPLKVDIDAAGARSLVQRYSVAFVPTIVLVDARGKELDRTGYVSADELVEFVNEAHEKTSPPQGE